MVVRSCFTIWSNLLRVESVSRQNETKSNQIYMNLSFINSLHLKNQSNHLRQQQLMRNWHLDHVGDRILGQHWRNDDCIGYVSLRDRSSSSSFLACQLLGFVPWLYRHEPMNRALYHPTLERWGPIRSWSMSWLEPKDPRLILHMTMWIQRLRHFPKQRF